MNRSENGTHHNRKTRLAAGIMAFALLLFVLFSVFFIAHEADHECSGEDCPVCALIMAVENNLRHVGSGAAVLAAAPALAYLILAVLAPEVPELAVSTPILRKTRLNN